MQRYLLFFNYRGTNFRGSQKQVKRSVVEWWTADALKEEQSTVQGALETGLVSAVKPANNPVFFLSSRTDAGVHAYSNTGTVDLQNSEETYFDPRQITSQLNFYFIKRNLDVRLS